MTALQYVLAILVIIVSVIITALVMLQESKQQGLSGAIGGAAETFFGKNKGKSIEAKMKKWTWICLIVLVVFSITFYILQLESIWA